MIHSRTIKDMLILIKENKELIKTIIKILQMFPEGVIIQTLNSETMEYVTKYINKAAKDEILDLENELGSNRTISSCENRIKLADEDDID